MSHAHSNDSYRCFATQCTINFFLNIYLTDSNLYAYLITIEDVWLRNEQAASAEVDHAQNTVQRYRAMFPIPTATE